jgi:hypothetical protein
MSLRRSLKPSFVLAGLLVVSAAAPRPAHAAAPEDPELSALRQACQSALGGEPAAAREACMKAYLRGQSAEDLRHSVAALVDGRATPTMGEFAEATFKADVAVKIAPNEPWGYSARCLVALKIGDRDLLEGCLADLKRVAPDHPETKRLLALRPGDSVFATLGRWLLALALFGTLAHALKKARKVDPPSAQRAVVPILLGVLALTAAMGRDVRAETTIKGKNLSGLDISDANPEASLPSSEDQLKDPLRFGYVLQDFLANAQEAVKRGDIETAARYYRALGKAVPTAYGPAHLCEALTKLGDGEGALAACRETITREGVTVADYARLAGLLMEKPDPLPRDIRAELEALIAHVSGQAEAGVEGERLRCNVATRLHDVRMLEACTSKLASMAAGDPVTISFQWTLAMETHHYAEAQKIVERARKAGVADQAVAMMEEATVALRRKWFLRAIVWGAGIALALLLVGVGARRYGLPRRRVAV